MQLQQFDQKFAPVDSLIMKLKENKTRPKEIFIVCDGRKVQLFVVICSLFQDIGMCVYPQDICIRVCACVLNNPFAVQQHTHTYIRITINRV